MQAAAMGREGAQPLCPIGYPRRVFFAGLERLPEWMQSKARYVDVGNVLWATDRKWIVERSMDAGMNGQYSEYRRRLYALEKVICECFPHDAIGAGRAGEEMYHLARQYVPEVDDLTRADVSAVFRLYGGITLSRQTLHLLADMDTHGLSDIGPDSFEVARREVEGVSGVDLSQVRERCLDQHRSNYVEASCQSCGERSHHVFYSLDSNQVNSVDLLCHELGHAADFTLARRDSSDDDILLRHSSLAESVAYFHQFRYLKLKGSEKKRKGAVAAFLYPYLVYLMCRYCNDRELDLRQVDPRDVVMDPAFQPFVEAYSSILGSAAAARDALGGILENTQSRFGGIADAVYQELNPRLGIPLALLFLESPSLRISNVSKKNKLKTGLECLIDELCPDGSARFSALDQTVLRFIGG